MASAVRLGRVLKQRQPNISTSSKTSLLQTVEQIRSPIQNHVFSRHASLVSPTSGGAQEASYFRVPRWLVYLTVPSVALTWGVLRFTDPDIQISNTQPNRCKEIHATDLDDWIKAHPDDIDDAHATGWNKMYENFTKAAQVEVDSAKQLAQTAKEQDNRMRYIKQKGVMSTLAGNKTINEQLKELDDAELGHKASLSDRMVARGEQFKKNITRATKGNAVIGQA